MTIGTPFLTLASINIERSKHLSRVASFLSAHAPEVVCLQELVADDVATLSDGLGYEHRFFVPMCRYPDTGGPRPVGVGILSHHALTSTEAISYGGGGSGQDLIDRTSEESRYRTIHYYVALVSISVGGETFTIGTTHFPWTDDARTADFQHTACDNLVHQLKDRSLALAGDFNAPRGKAIFAKLAAQWIDHIPPTYATSIDPVLHRAGPLQVMVDGLFSTPDYSVSKVAFHQGVSDHCAITADIGRRARLGSDS